MTLPKCRVALIATARLLSWRASMLLMAALACATVVRADDGSTYERLRRIAPKNLDDLNELQVCVTSVLRETLPAIVAVGFSATEGATEERRLEAGHFASGVIIREDGLILSQYHVTHKRKNEDRKPGDQIDVVFHDGRRLKAELLGSHREVDLSMLRLLEQGKYQFLGFAEDDALSLGEWVVKPGHPGGYRGSRGAVSRLGRIIYQNRLNVLPDCMLTGGDSGGPLINLDGKIVGIMQHSSMPEIILMATASSRTNSLFSFSTTRVLREKIPAMQMNLMPQETGDERSERQRLFNENVIMLPQESWTKGDESKVPWQAVTKNLRHSVVEVLNDEERTAYGTVVGADGWVLTKASEIGPNPRCRAGNGEPMNARITGTHVAFDLAMLKIDASDLRPVQWTNQGLRDPGTFVVVPDAAGSPIAAGIISAHPNRFDGPFSTAITPAPRRPRPKAIPPEFLGRSVKGQGFSVTASIGSAAKAGILVGDIITEIEGRPFQSMRDLTDVMSGKSPGDTLRISLTHDGQRVERSLTIEGTPYRAPSVNSPNHRFDAFPTVFEHDIPLTHEECGGPVVGIDGKTLGITIARIGAQGCAAIPADAIQPLIKRLMNIE